MAETRVRKPFPQDRVQPNGQVTSPATGELMSETQVIERVPEKSWQKVSTRIKNAFMGKVPHIMRNPSNLVVRTATGAVYITLTVVCILASEVTTALYLALLCAICANEFYYMLRSDAKLPNEFLGVCAAALLPLSAWLFGLGGIAVTFVVFVLVLLVWYVFWPPARISDVAVSLFGAVYTGAIMSTVMVLRMSLPDPWGAVLVLVLFASVWGNDAVAYLVGSAIGKHKLAPHISPKKSWEGFIAGLIFAMVCWCGIAQIPGVVMSIPMALVFGFINGLSGVLGDLVESRIKRNSGFKDSGTIMPGHGGLLDRCDSQFLVTLTGTIMLVLGGCIPYVL